MLAFLKRWRWQIFALVVVGVVVLFIYNSKTIQECISKPYQNYENQPPKERPALFFVPFRRHVGCTWFWLDKNSGAVIALFTIIIGVFTGSLFVDGRNNARKELRAYIAMEGPFFVEGIGTTSEIEAAKKFIKIKIRNFGKTPAHRLKIYTGFTDPPHGLQPGYPDKESFVAEQMLHPDQPFNSSIGRPPLEKPYETAGWFVYGRLIYRDIYYQWWVTRFCYIYGGQNKFIPSGAYNDEGGPHKTQEKVLTDTSMPT